MELSSGDNELLINKPLELVEKLFGPEKALEGFWHRNAMNGTFTFILREADYEQDYDEDSERDEESSYAV